MVIYGSSLILERSKETPLRSRSSGSGIPRGPTGAQLQPQRGTNQAKPRRSHCTQTSAPGSRCCAHTTSHLPSHTKTSKSYLLCSARLHPFTPGTAAGGSKRCSERAQPGSTSPHATSSSSRRTAGPTARCHQHGRPWEGRRTRAQRAGSPARRGARARGTSTGRAPAGAGLAPPCPRRRSPGRGKPEQR